MAITVTIARLALATLFVIAAVGKLRDRDGTRVTLIAFGVPRALAPALGLLLPAAEVAAAAALLADATARWGAVAVLVLLAAFTTAAARAMRSGRRPDCHCFGSLGSHAVGRGTVVRNAALAALAALAFAAAPGHPLREPFAAATTQDLLIAALGLATALLVGAAWLCWALLRQNGRLVLRVDALEARPGGDRTPGAPVVRLQVGAPAPPFAAYDLDGERTTLDGLLEGGRPLVLVFTDPDCSACATLLPRIARIQSEDAGVVRVVLLSRGSVARTREERRRHDLVDVLLQADDAVAVAYGAYGVPSAVAIDPDGLVAIPAAMGADAIERLLDGALRAPRPVLEVRAP